MKGKVFILNNENHGTITSDGQYAAGVLGSLLILEMARNLLLIIALIQAILSQTDM